MQIVLDISRVQVLVRNDFEREVRHKSTSQKLKNFKKKNINRKSSSQGYLEKVLEKLNERLT